MKHRLKFLDCPRDGRHCGFARPTSGAGAGAYPYCPCRKVPSGLLPYGTVLEWDDETDKLRVISLPEEKIYSEFVFPKQKATKEVK